MSDEKRARLYDAVEVYAPLLGVPKSKLFLKLKSFMQEEVVDPFTSEKTITVHRAPEESCSSCQA